MIGNNKKTKKEDLKKVIRDLIEIKQKHFREGKATQADANFLSLKILREYPQIIQNIVDRFPIFIIDEAQDTTTIQMAIIDLLNDAAINKIIIIGDPDQAIFEWNTADPSLFIEKYESPFWTKLELNENYRSSSSICNLINCFYSNNIISESPDKDFPESPKLLNYSDTNDVNNIVIEFKKKCNELGYKNEEIAIVYRGTSFAEQYLGITTESSIYEDSPWENNHYFVKDFVYGKFLIDKGYYREGLKLLEKGFLKKCYNLQYISVEEIKKYRDEKGFRLYRQELFNIIEKLPSTINASLGEWIENVNSKTNFNFIIKRSKSSILINKLFIDKIR
ncbi:MAG: UvrD-helicase domain-containing protein [Tannerellaceae bacterium]|nr:UvrD-helicase domain-containing protein [Tannerellaceae bacterium]